MQSSGVVDVFTVKTLLAVSRRCLTAMHGRGEMLHDLAYALLASCLFCDFTFSLGVQRPDFYGLAT